MSLNLPTVYQNIYYVYKHICPETSKLLYIGQGSKGRAWVYAQGELRAKEHDNYLMQLTEKGFTPETWVFLVETGLTKKESIVLETALIWDSEEFPLFNSKKDHCCKLSPTDIESIYTLRKQGYSYESIGEQVGFSTMTVFRVFNGKTKNYAK